MRQAIAKVEPGLLFKKFRRLRDFCRLDLLEQGLDSPELRPAVRTLAEMPADPFFLLGVSVIMQDDLLFAEVLHGHQCTPTPRCGPLASGSRCWRSFCTARKTVFLAALVLRSNALLISSIDWPSMWCMVKATRSAGVRSPRACAILVLTSRLSKSRSGPGPGAGSCTWWSWSGSIWSAI